MSNTSTTTSSDMVDDNARYLSIMWETVIITEGVLMIIANLSIVVPVAMLRPLRSDNNCIIFATHAFFDMITGVGYAAGVRRLPIYWDGTENAAQRPWDCLWTVTVMTWLFSEQGTMLMMCVVALDRILLLTAPLIYIQLPRTYSLVILGAMIAYGVGNTIICVAWSYNNPSSFDPISSSLCFFFESAQEYAKFHQSVMPIAAITSVLLYAVVLVLYTWRSKKSTAKLSTVQKAQISAQRRVTQSMLLQCLSTIVFYVLPIGTWQASQFGYIDPLPMLAAHTIFGMANMNTIANTLILILRHKHLMRGIRAVLKCETVPNTMTVWMGNKTK